MHLLPAVHPLAPPRLVQRRSPGLEYFVEHVGGQLYILSSSRSRDGGYSLFRWGGGGCVEGGGGSGCVCDGCALVPACLVRRGASGIATWGSQPLAWASISVATPLLP